jgi:hypothetical protein
MFCDRLTPFVIELSLILLGTGYGRHTGGGAMEHLAHVIFGKRDLDEPEFTKEEYCTNYLPECPSSPCEFD